MGQYAPRIARQTPPKEVIRFTVQFKANHLAKRSSLNNMWIRFRQQSRRTKVLQSRRMNMAKWVNAIVSRIIFWSAPQRRRHTTCFAASGPNEWIHSEVQGPHSLLCSTLLHEAVSKALSRLLRWRTTCFAGEGRWPLLGESTLQCKAVKFKSCSFSFFF
jgi:hypothetical protein